MPDEANQTHEPTDAELASEFAAAIKGEPAPAPKGADTITPAAVAGEKAAAPTLPDSAALRQKLNGLMQPQAPEAPAQDPREVEMAELRKAITLFSQIQQQQATGMTQQQLLQQQNSPEFLARKATEEARAAREKAEAYRERMEQLERERQLNDLRSGISAFVKSNAAAAPITASSESAELVLELMHANPELSESKALAEVEGKLSDFINKHAPLLGWHRGAESKAQEPRDSFKEPPTLNPGAAGIAPSKAWDELTDDEQELELIKMLRQSA